MKRWTTFLALAALATPMSAMAQEMKQASDEMDEGSHGELHAEVEALAAQWIEAFNSGDVDALVAHYADGAHSLPYNAPPAKGKEAIRANLAAWFESGAGIQMTAEVWEVHEAGDKLIEIGGYTVTGADGEHLDHGKYLNVLVAEDGEWKILREIWNSSMAAPEPEVSDEHAEMMKEHAEQHEKMKEQHEKMMEDRDEIDEDHAEDHDEEADDM